MTNAVGLRLDPQKTGVRVRVICFVFETQSSCYLIVQTGLKLMILQHQVPG